MLAQKLLRVASPAVPVPRRTGRAGPRKPALISRAAPARQPRPPRRLRAAPDTRGTSAGGDRSSPPPAAALDPDLLAVLELADDEELCELHRMLHSRSIFSPVVKSMVLADASFEEEARGPLSREQLVLAIEQRFRFLAADAVSTLRGRLPSYRGTLLAMVQQLEVPLPRAQQLATEDLEAELFLFLLKQHSDAVNADASAASAAAAGHASLGSDGQAAARDAAAAHGRSPMRLVQRVLAPLALAGRQEVLPALAKLGSTSLVVAARNRLLGSMGLAAAPVQAQAALSLMVSAGAGGVSASVSGRVAVEAAKQAAKQAAKVSAGRFAAARGLLAMLGPLMWVSTALELSLMSIGSDWGRVARVVFRLAQIRLLRTYGWQEGPAARLRQ